MKKINNWRIWGLFMDGPNDWTPVEKFQLWFDFWWNQWGYLIVYVLFLLLLAAAMFGLSTGYEHLLFSGKEVPV